MLDIVIILILLFGGLVGYKQGFTKALVNLVGIFIILILSFVLKDPIAEFMMLNLPFFDFYGLIKGVSVLNILVYEVVAFGLCFSILFIVLKILFVFTNVFEKILSMTIILGFLSKILGFVLGVLKNYVIIFIILFILSLPNFSDNKIISNSNLKGLIIQNTPILSNLTDDIVTVFDEFSSLKDEYKNTKDGNKFNYDSLDLLLKYKIVKTETVEKLINSGKLHIDGSNKLLNKYKNGG
ncbi:MAG: CvpA family protein [Bacilli bacterium]|nr:CvpA family protein [Bacilli bacterium]